MIKEVVVFGLILIFAISLVSASGLVNSSKNATNLTILKQSTNKILTDEINIPSYLQAFAKILFGYKSDQTVDLESLVIMCAIWLILFLVFHTLLGFVSVFENNIVSWGSSFAVVSLVGLSGAINKITYFFFGANGIFFFFGNWKIIRFLFVLAILAAIFIGASNVLNILKDNLEIANAKTAGREISLKSYLADLYRKMLGKE